MGEHEKPDREGGEVVPVDEATRQSTIAKLAAALRRTDEQPKLLVAA